MRTPRAEVEIPTCSFCGNFIVDIDSIKAGICVDCRDVIRDEQDVAWDSHMTRMCENPACSEVLEVGQHQYCDKCSNDIRRINFGLDW